MALLREKNLGEGWFDIIPKPYQSKFLKYLMEQNKLTKEEYDDIFNFMYEKPLIKNLIQLVHTFQMV